MKPTKLSAQVFYELPPVLAHYVEQERNLWLDGMPTRGSLSVREQRGVFVGLHSLGLQRKLLIDSVGRERARAISYRVGHELGRHDAAAHLDEFKRNARLALQASPVFRQLQGCGAAQTVRFEFDLDARTLYRETVVSDSAEALAYGLLVKDDIQCVCWSTAGYFAGHMSQILGRPVLTIERECIGKSHEACRFVSKFDAEWDDEAAWVREAFEMDSVDEELAKRDERAGSARKGEQRARYALSELNRRLRSDLMIDGLVAEAPSMQPAMRRARQVMASQAPVVIVGEPGTGRETVARAVHYGGARRRKPFVSVDCVGLQGHLLTQELFGYVKGGVPGATRAHVGAYQRAHGGTLYLSEVANLDIEAQVFLLRAMRDGVVFPLGGDEPVKADVRVIAATQYDLADKVASGDFLEHLHYALAIVAMELPPLRDRDGDVLRLAELFVQEFAERYQRPGLRLSQDVQRVLLDCAWPGNVRQLRNVIEHAVIMAEGRRLDLAELPDDVLATRSRRPQEALTEDVVRAALRRTRGNRTHAAELLGIGRTSLWRAMKRFKID